MNNKHSEQWKLLRKQGKRHKREKAILIAIIVILVIINLVLSNIIWEARRNNQNAGATMTANEEAAVAAAPVIAIIDRCNKRANKKDRVNELGRLIVANE